MSTKLSLGSLKPQTLVPSASPRSNKTQQLQQQQPSPAKKPQTQPTSPVKKQQQQPPSPVKKQQVQQPPKKQQQQQQPVKQQQQQPVKQQHPVATPSSPVKKQQQQKPIQPPKPVNQKPTGQAYEEIFEQSFIQDILSGNTQPQWAQKVTTPKSSTKGQQVQKQSPTGQSSSKTVDTTDQKKNGGAPQLKKNTTTENSQEIYSYIWGTAQSQQNPGQTQGNKLNKKACDTKGQKCSQGQAPRNSNTNKRVQSCPTKNYIYEANLDDSFIQHLLQGGEIGIVIKQRTSLTCKTAQTAACSPAKTSSPRKVECPATRPRRDSEDLFDESCIQRRLSQ